MYYKLCPFCNEIKPLSEFNLTKIFHTSCISKVCYDCEPLEIKYRENEQFRKQVHVRKRIMDILKSRIVARGKAAIDIGASEIFTCLGLSIYGYKIYLETFFDESINWENISDWEIDHIKAVSKYDLTNKYERMKAFHFTNTKPTLKSDHKSKTKADLKTN